MHLLTNTAPRTVENQHYVMIPAEGGYKAEAVYAASPEAAVAETRRLFTTGDFGEPVPDFFAARVQYAPASVSIRRPHLRVRIVAEVPS